MAGDIGPPLTDRTLAAYQDRLAAVVGDGGGCAETWAAVSQFRAPCRRSFLTALIAGAAGFSTAQPATADTTTGEDVDPDEACTVTRCHPTQGRDIAGTAASDHRFTALFRRFRDNGWRPNRNTTYIVTTTIHADHVDELDEDVTYCSLVVPFDTGRNRETAVLLWREHPTTDATAVSGFHSIHGSTAADVPDDHWELTAYTLDADGTVATDTEQLENFLGCRNVNWPCVLDLAAAYAGMFGSCALCSGVLTAPSCALCISTVLNWMRAVRCEWCHD